MAISDTDPEARRIQDNLIRAMSGSFRLEILDRINETAKHLALEELRELYPAANQAELKRLLADLLLGPELAYKVYGPGPAVLETKQAKIITEEVMGSVTMMDVLADEEIRELSEKVR